ncbi:ABC transporter substrate-binding protein [Undibacterium pigrum]|uniref:ABC-type transport system substrate-binding protein n=1 Tax=Undibacterium pigrum TaxID=401470 RepID=A0A318JD20_9BURK|nr:ABC transporter substrate-binding protein [Undibacterium pigrum]PXX45486.1 ABC-type transport system substrate-binding protein [Undibacterium pigrum]
MTLHIATIHNLFHIDPLKTDAVCHPLSSLLYQTLLRINHSGDAPLAELTSSWTHSADFTKWSFVIAPACFQNGQPVLASHVARSFARHVWPSSTSIFANTWRELLAGINTDAGTCSEGEIPAGLYADDEQNRLLIQLQRPYCPLLEIIAHPAMGICLQTDTGELTGSGPMMVSMATDTEIQFQHNPGYAGARHLPENVCIQLYDRFDDVLQALQTGRANAALLERKHQLKLDAVLDSMPKMRSTPLRDRWSGMLILNAAGIFNKPEMRKDFHTLVQQQAREKLAAVFHADFIPADILTVPARPAHEFSLAEFQQRWQAHFSATSVRIIYAIGRGPLTAALDCANSVLQACGIHCELIRTKNAEQVYDYVASGEFDIVARGWIQDYDDADQYFGVYEKQAPQPEARAAYMRFYEAVAAARHLDKPDIRSAAYALAMKELDDEYLCINICHDHHRIFHDNNLHLQALCRDPFDL